MTDETPPIGTQVAALAAADPDAPAITCSGQTLTRRELELSTNRLARAFAERGVGVAPSFHAASTDCAHWIELGATIVT